MASKSCRRKRSIVMCPRCLNLQMVYSTAKTHKCPYCGRTITLRGSETEALYVTDSPREASRIIMKLKSKRTTQRPT